MASVIDEIYVCGDCYTLIGSGDESSFDYYYGDGAEKRLADVWAAIEALPGHACAGDGEKDQEFSWSSCDCCGEHLGGSRHNVVILD